MDWQHPAPQDSAFSLAFNTKASIYKFLKQFPDREARFFGAMGGVGKIPSKSSKDDRTGLRANSGEEGAAQFALRAPRVA
ncbi:hypothetical protein XPA_006320 [Xanthoria parietina]